MDDQRDTNRQDDEQRSGGGEAPTAASKGINPVQHSERGAGPAQTASKGINPVQHSERQQDEDPGRGGGREGGAGNEKGNG